MTSINGQTWVSENLRDIAGWKADGIPLTVSSNEAAKLFDNIVRQYVSYHIESVVGDLATQIRCLLEVEPDFVMGRVLELCMRVSSQKRSPYNDHAYHQSLADVVELAKSKNCTARELKHAEAVYHCAHGSILKAISIWEKILDAHPNDLLALKMHYDNSFFMGTYEKNRDIPASIIRRWEPPQPELRSFLHGIYSYGLEECGDFVESRRQAQIGLSYDRTCGWCVHAIAHCYEMESDYTGGLAFMEETKPNWAHRSALAPHNLWHTALFNVEKGDYETALSIYDMEMVARRSGIILDMTDSTSLLQRLQMEGVEVGAERWRELYSLAKKHLDDHILLFNDAHFSIVLSNSSLLLDEDNEVRDLCKKHLASIENFANSGRGDTADLLKSFGLDLCTAIYDYNNERYADTFSRLYPIRGEMVALGGSWAQRDVFKQILIHSGLRSNDPGIILKALGALEERELLKPNSPVAKRLVDKHKSRRHDELVQEEQVVEQRVR